jgi:hypothetical protein
LPVRAAWNIFKQIHCSASDPAYYCAIRMKPMKMGKALLQAQGI